MVAVSFEVSFSREIDNLGNYEACQTQLIIVNFMIARAKSEALVNILTIYPKTKIV